MPYYAQFALSTNKVYHVAELREKVDQPDMVEIEEYNTSLLGKIYDSFTNSFIDDPAPKTEPAKSETQIILEKIALIESDIRAIKEVTAVQEVII